MIQIDFHTGDVVRVHQKIKEAKDKFRTQIFEGTVIKIRGAGENKMFTVRKNSYDGVAVERIWPANGLTVEKVEVKSKPKKTPRRSKLYNLRNKAKKK